jgi:transposase
MIEKARQADAPWVIKTVAERRSPCKTKARTVVWSQRLNSASKGVLYYTRRKKNEGRKEGIHRYRCFKKTLDIAIGQNGEFHTIDNTSQAIRGFVSSLSRDTIAQVIVESTGGLELPIIRALSAASISVALINPARVRHFAKATGLYAKTDRLDAQLLAEYGKRNERY